MGYIRKLHRNVQPRQWPGLIPVRFQYTAGIAGQTFFRRLKEEGKLYGLRCSDCAITYVPPRIFCERCFAELTEWVDVGLEGELYSYTIVYRDLMDRSLETPRIVGLVKLYRADTLMFHNILTDPTYVRIGMKLRAVLRPTRQRRGAITDIRGFMPILKTGKGGERF